jgi:hypothetical protein
LAHKISYFEEDDSDVLTLTLPNGRKSETEDLPEGGIGLITVGDETFVIVTPEYETMTGDKLEHDTVYRLVAVPTEVEGEFPDLEEEGEEGEEGADIVDEEG